MKKSMSILAVIALIAMIFTSCASKKPYDSATEKELRADSEKMQEHVDQMKEENRGSEK